MTWVLDEPIYIFILSAVLLLFLGFALIQTGYRPLFHAMLGVVALTGGLLILEHVVQTDREQIEAALDQMARDVESNDLEIICSHVYSGAPEVLARAQAEFPRYKFDKVTIKNNVEVQFVEGRQPRTAHVTFNVVVDVHQGELHFARAPSFVRVTLVQEDGQWRVADYSHDERAVFGHRRDN